MVTPLTDAINALTTYANETTGANDTDLSSAVATLVAGYGSGDGGYDINDLADGTEPSGAITIDTATAVAQYAFHYRTALTSVSAPVCTTVNKYAFEGCTGLTSISFPSCTAVNDYVFNQCSHLTAVAFPSLTSRTFARFLGSCTALTIVDLGKTVQIYNQTFLGSSALRTLILRKTDDITTLFGYSSSALGGIYDNPTESTIYVPSALISSYQSASNWSSAYSAGVTFTAIEGSTYETQYGDGTPIS